MNETPPPANNRLVSRLMLIAMLLLAPVVLFGGRGALKSTSNDPRQWLPKNFEATDVQDWFQQHFGIDEIAVVSWPGCTIDDERVERLARKLDRSSRFQRVLSGPRTIDQMTSAPLRIPRAEAIDRVRGFLVGPDGKTTCLVVEMSAAGQADRTGTVEQIVASAATECGLARDELRLGGPTVDAAAIDAESKRLLFELAGLSGLVSLLMAGFRLGSLKLALIVLVGAGYATAASLALMYYSGGTMNLLMTMLPPLIYVLTISAAVHLVNYYRDAIRDTGLATAARKAVAHGWLPCVMAGGTTAIGLVSLGTSKIGPIQQFGVYSAIGMVVSVIVLLVYLPAALTVFPTPASGSADESSGKFATWFITRVVRHRLTAIVACVLLMGFFGFGLSRIGSTVKLQDRFVAQSRILNDYRWLEEHLGPLVPLEVILRFGKDSPLKMHERLSLVADVQNRINSVDDQSVSLSASAFIPPATQGRGFSQLVGRTMFQKRIERSTPAMKDAHMLADTADEQLWRISVRANALSDLDYGLFTSTLERAVAPLLANQETSHVRATFTGVIPLIYKAQRQLLDDLVRSFFTAFIAIAIVMVVVMKSWKAGLLAMIPNVFPAIVIFGGMGWMNVLVQIGSVMTASAALGIAVDDTVHFLTWFQRGLNAGHSRRESLVDAFDRCAGAMIHTTLICGTGLAVFAISSFVPILHFAWLMVALLLAALVGDLMLLPALLVGRESPAPASQPAPCAEPLTTAASRLP